MAPVAVDIQGKVNLGDGSQPPPLEEVTVDFDKNAALDATDLPTCKRSRLETRGIEAARRTCHGAIVGTGVTHIAIRSSEQGSISLPLTLFNGGVEGDTTTLFIQSYMTVPTPAPIIATVKLTRVHDGRYGLQAVSKIPRIADGSGSVLDFSFSIKRFVEHEGANQHYAMARCFDQHLLARMKGVFDDGTTLNGTVVRACSPEKLIKGSGVTARGR